VRPTAIHVAPDLAAARRSQLRTHILTDQDTLGALSAATVSECVLLATTAAALVASNVRKVRRTAYGQIDAEATAATGARRSPEATANFFSTITFWWLTPLMVLGYKKPLEMEDLWELDESETVRRLSEAFEHHWAAQRRHGGRQSLAWALAHAFGAPFLFAAVFKLGQDALAFVQPQLLSQLLLFISSYDGSDPEVVPTPEPAYRGYIIAVTMFVVAVVQTLLLHQYFHRAFMTGMRVRAAVVTAIYRKALRLANQARQQSTAGEIVNHMSVDAQKLMDLMAYLHILWSGPLQIIGKARGRAARRTGGRCAS